MTHDDAFLQSIRDEPDDDVPRLIYADWLEEHGRPEHAEFIRLQCELARLPEEYPGRSEKEQREHELLLEHGEWLGPLRRLLPEADCSVVFQRGFVSEVTFWGLAGARRLADRAGAIF